MKSEEAKRLKELELENRRLKKLLAEADPGENLRLRDLGFCCPVADVIDNAVATSWRTQRRFRAPQLLFLAGRAPGGVRR